MEVIKCGLCKEEIEYAQRCRVYIKTNESRPYQRISRRPHIGRFKLISTAKSTEHISFARRLKRLRAIRDNIDSSNNSSDSHRVDLKVKPSRENKADSSVETSLERKPVEEHSEPLKSFSAEVKSIKEVSDSLKKTVNTYIISKKTALSRKLVKSGNTEPGIIKNLSPRKGPLRRKMSHPHFQSSFEEYIKPSLTKNNSTANANKETKRKNSDLNAEFDQNKKLQVISTPKSVRNGPLNNSKNSDCETYYWLEMPKTKQPELRRLGYDFENLVTEVKHMKLPNPDWKIKIMVHKQEMVSVSFTKKLFPEKIVSVNAKSLVCDIAMDGEKLILLGSPIYIHSIKDLEIMLDIVNDIGPDSPMITYLKPVA